MAAETLTAYAGPRREGEAARDVGMDLAARHQVWFIHRDSLRLLDAMMSREDHTASTDDATDDLGNTFADGGKWRGSIPKALAAEGLIAKAGVGPSNRPARHRGYVTRWRAADLAGIDRRRAELRQWLAEHTCPAKPVALTLFDDLAGERTVDHVA